MESGERMKAELTDFTVPELVKLMREWTGQTQEQFAHKVGYSISHVRHIEQNHRNLYLATFLDWCKENEIEVYMEKKEK